ncbi:MAG: FKBP-type peptidyl-prolyl cis-trans isomerase [Prevotella sp.]|nr:FKBP-type peptidyl-prolyl cis-trans isomerase [Prevotella sp.]
MDNKQNKYISVSYQLYTVDADGSRHLEEQTQQGKPFTFISGFGFSLDGFEERIASLEPGEKFDFTLTPAEAFGDYMEEGVHKLQREVFMINDHFDHDNIYPGAVITLMDEEEHRFMARVMRVEADFVTVDTNHPLAGKTLQFTGIVLENREPTNTEIQNMLNHMSHECGGCDDCDGCGEEGHQHKHDGGCGCGHCHH